MCVGINSSYLYWDMAPVIGLARCPGRQYQWTSLVLVSKTSQLMLPLSFTTTASRGRKESVQSQDPSWASSTLVTWLTEPLISYSHGGVRESRRWSKHHRRWLQLLILLLLFLIHAGRYLVSAATSLTPGDIPLLCFQSWPTAALMCRLYVKRSGTSWRSWTWSSPRVSRGGHTAGFFRGLGCLEPWRWRWRWAEIVDVERVYM